MLEKELSLITSRDASGMAQLRSENNELKSQMKAQDGEDDKIISKMNHLLEKSKKDLDEAHKHHGQLKNEL
jgi:hypothetical protein